jgi:acyl-CoA thioester hydrolase
MTQPYTTRLRVRHYEMNARNELPMSALFRLFQETAMRVTRAAGFGVEWFVERQTVWVLRAMIVEHLCPIHYPNELDVSSWLSDASKVRVHREYLARDAATGEIVARGRAEWVHLNGKTMMPARIPAEIFARMQPNGVRAVPRLEPRAYPAPRAPIEYRTQRRVQRYETDGLQHVNNAVYVDWLEEALADAVAPFTSSERYLRVRRHDIEYVRAALPGDHVEIVLQCVGAGHCASAWEAHIHRGDELLVRDHITALWVDEAGKPIRVKC